MEGDIRIVIPPPIITKMSEEVFLIRMNNIQFQTDKETIKKIYKDAKYALGL